MSQPSRKKAVPQATTSSPKKAKAPRREYKVGDVFAHPDNDGRMMHILTTYKIEGQSASLLFSGGSSRARRVYVIEYSKDTEGLHVGMQTLFEGEFNPEKRGWKLVKRRGTNAVEESIILH